MKKIIILFLTAMICISIHGQANDKYRLKYNNPDLIVDLGVGLWGMPIPIDYDGDGLMDLLKGSFISIILAINKHHFLTKE